MLYNKGVFGKIKLLKIYKKKFDNGKRLLGDLDIEVIWYLC